MSEKPENYDSRPATTMNSLAHKHCTKREMPAKVGFYIYEEKRTSVASGTVTLRRKGDLAKLDISIETGGEPLKAEVSLEKKDVNTLVGMLVCARELWAQEYVD